MSKEKATIIAAIIAGIFGCIAAIIALASPLVEKAVDDLSVDPTNTGFVEQPDSEGIRSTEISLEITSIALQQTQVAITNEFEKSSVTSIPDVQTSCYLQHIEYIDTRTSAPLESGFQATIGHNADGSVKIFLSGQGETYRNYYQLTGNCSQDEKIELLKKELPVIESNTQNWVSDFALQDPVIVP